MRKSVRDSGPYLHRLARKLTPGRKILRSQAILGKGQLPSARWWFAVSSVSSIAVGLFGFGAAISNPVPSYLVSGAAVGSILWIRLRRKRDTQAVALGAWALIAVLGAVAMNVGVAGRALALGLAVVVVSALWVWLVWTGSAHFTTRQSQLTVVGKWSSIQVSRTLGLVPPLLALLIALPLLERGGLELPDFVRSWVLRTALSAGAAALLISGVASALRSSSSIDRVTPKFRRLSEPVHKDLSERSLLELRRRSRRPRADLVETLELFALQVVNRTQRVASVVRYVLLLAAQKTSNGLVAIAERLTRIAILTGRRAQETFKFTVRSLIASRLVLVRLGRRFARSVLVPLPSLVVTSICLWGAASEAIEYLHGDEIAAAFRAFGLLGIAAVGTFLAWGSLSGVSLRAAWELEAHSVHAHLADALLFFVAAAWLLGIAGLMGYGVVRPGRITIASSIILVSAVVWIYVKRDREEAPEVKSPGELVTQAFEALRVESSRRSTGRSRIAARELLEHWDGEEDQMWLRIEAEELLNIASVERISIDQEEESDLYELRAHTYDSTDDEGEYYILVQHLDRAVVKNALERVMAALQAGDRFCDLKVLNLSSQSTTQSMARQDPLS